MFSLEARRIYHMYIEVRQPRFCFRNRLYRTVRPLNSRLNLERGIENFRNFGIRRGLINEDTWKAWSGGATLGVSGQRSK